MILPFAVVLALRWAALLSKNTSSGTATLRKIASRTELLSLVLWLFLATLLFVALVLSRSRMGIISILVSLVAIVALAGTASMPARTRVAVATLFFLGVLGLIVWIGIDPVMSRFETLGQEYKREFRQRRLSGLHREYWGNSRAQFGRLKSLYPRQCVGVHSNRGAGLV